MAKSSHRIGFLGTRKKHRRSDADRKRFLTLESLEVRSLLAGVTTDKLDYAPGETAIITAEGFAVGEKVELQVQSDSPGPGQDPFVIEDGQIVGRLAYERLTSQPNQLYGNNTKSHYQRQGIALSKHFKLPGNS